MGLTCWDIKPFGLKESEVIHSWCVSIPSRPEAVGECEWRLITTIAAQQSFVDCYEEISFL